jgi:NADH dehydrogenase [ubiquinone] 1 alpha subcomplex assembly factor 1
MARTLFRFDESGSVQGWAPIDDRVMGGVSHSRLRHADDGHAVFEGVVSLQNNGGFASVRSAAGPLGLAQAQACVIDAQGDGRQYKLNLFTGDAFDAMSYQAIFTAATGGWHSTRLPLAEFKPRFRGRQVTGAPPLDPARIRQVGLMASGGQPGAFALCIRSIELV